MIYKNRFEAGLVLADRLSQYQETNAIILAVPRGGIQLGYPIAKALNLPLDVVLAKKLVHPVHKEVAIGGATLSDYFYDLNIGVDKAYIEQEIIRVRNLLKKRQTMYYGLEAPESVKDRIAIIVDDGIATGNTLMACVNLVRKSQPSKIVVAVPIGVPSSNKKFEESEIIDEFICLHAPENFSAVGQFYEDFSQVSDEEVFSLLKNYRSERLMN